MTYIHQIWHNVAYVSDVLKLFSILKFQDCGQPPPWKQKNRGKLISWVMMMHGPNGSLKLIDDKPS